MSSIYWFMEIRIICKDWTHIGCGIGLVSYTKQQAVSVSGITYRKVKEREWCFETTKRAARGRAIGIN